MEVKRTRWIRMELGPKPVLKVPLKGLELGGGDLGGRGRAKNNVALFQHGAANVRQCVRMPLLPVLGHSVGNVLGEPLRVGSPDVLLHMQGRDALPPFAQCSAQIDELLVEGHGGPGPALAEVFGFERAAPAVNSVDSVELLSLLLDPLEDPLAEGWVLIHQRAVGFPAADAGVESLALHECAPLSRCSGHD